MSPASLSLKLGGPLLLSQQIFIKCSRKDIKGLLRISHKKQHVSYFYLLSRLFLGMFFKYMFDFYAYSSKFYFIS